MKRILIVETTEDGAAYTAAAARRLGYEPFFICNLPDYPADVRTQILSEEHLDMRTQDADDIYLALVRRGVSDVAAVVTLVDRRLEVACMLAQRYYVLGLDPQALPLRNKSHVAGLIPEYSPRSLGFDRRFDPVEVVTGFARESGRIALRPCKSKGSIGLGYFDANSLPEVLSAHMDGAPLADFSAPYLWMAQECKAGDHMTLEGFCQYGRLTFLASTGVPVSLNAKLHTQAACRALLERARIGGAYFHIEFVVAGDAAVITEATVGCIGKEGVPKNLAAAYGLDPVDVFYHVLAVSLNLPCANPYTQPRPKAGFDYPLSFD